MPREIDFRCPAFISRVYCERVLTVAVLGLLFGACLLIAGLTSLLLKAAGNRQRKLVVRNEDPVDRRNKIISLTKQGSKYSELLQPLLEDFYVTFQSDISFSEIESVTRMLHKLNKNLAR